jgi:hypothetical protein
VVVVGTFLQLNYYSFVSRLQYTVRVRPKPRNAEENVSRFSRATDTKFWKCYFNARSHDAIRVFRSYRYRYRSSYRHQHWKSFSFANLTLFDINSDSDIRNTSILQSCRPEPTAKETTTTPRVVPTPATEAATIVRELVTDVVRSRTRNADMRCYSCYFSTDSNSNGSYYYSNDNGSTYSNTGTGQSTYTPASGKK